MSIRQYAYGIAATVALFATGCTGPRFQKGVDYVFTPLHLAGRQVDGEAEANIYNKASCAITGKQNLEYVPTPVTAADATGIVAKTYFIFYKLHGHGSSGSGGKKQTPQVGGGQDIGDLVK